MGCIGTGASGGDGGVLPGPSSLNGYPIMTSSSPSAQKLDTQLVLLSQASQRGDGKVVPLIISRAASSGACWLPLSGRGWFNQPLPAQSPMQASPMGITSKVQTPVMGKSEGGIPFTYGPLQWVLRNRIYIGEINHRGQHYPGEHAAILDRATFDKVQQLLTEQRSSPTRIHHKMRSLLTSRIYDANGNRMAPSHSNKRGLRYRYYVSRALLDGTPDKAGKPARIPATAIEELVIKALREEQAETERRTAGVEWASLKPGDRRAGLRNNQNPVKQQSLDMRDRIGRGSIAVTQGSASIVSVQVQAKDHPAPPIPSTATDQHLVETMLEHVEVFENRIVITLLDQDAVNTVEGAESDDQEGGEGVESEQTLTKPRQIVIPCRLGQQPLLREVIASPTGDTTASESMLPNSQRRNRVRLIEAIHRARGWLDELLSGKAATVEAIATREGRSTRNISMMLNLAFLAPGVIESILRDDLPANLSASYIAQNLPLDWEDQRRWITAQG